MTIVRRLMALCRSIVASPAAANTAPAMMPLIRTPLDRWSDEDLRALLATTQAGGRVGYFVYYPGFHRIDDFTGLYVTVTAEAEETFSRMAGNHGRSDARRTCTIETIIAEISTGRGIGDAFLDHAG